MYRELVTVSEYYVLCFIPAQEKFFLSSPLRGFVLSHAQLNPRWVCGQPGLHTSGNLRSYPPVPCVCHGVKQLLKIMDFSFVYLSELMLSFSRPRQGYLLATVPFTTLHRLTFSLTFSHSVCPRKTTSPVAIAQSFSTNLFLSLSQSSHLCANPS